MSDGKPIRISGQQAVNLGPFSLELVKDTIRQGVEEKTGKPHEWRPMVNMDAIELVTIHPARPVKPAATKRTIQRANWLLTAEGDEVCVARSEHSDWIIPVSLADVHLLIADLREIAEAASPRKSMAELFARPEGESER